MTLKRFIKDNLLAVILGVLGLLFLVIGAVQFFGKKQSEIRFEKGDALERQEKGEEGAEEIVVHVGGAVQKPGVYRLKKESRVENAIAAAGGFSEAADQEYISKQINLAQKISDGIKIYIPQQGERTVLGTSGVSGNSVTSLVNVNTADAAQLEALSGIGPVTAAKIIDSRPYNSIEDLTAKKVVSASVFEKIKEKITVY